jgi:ribonuclease HI
MPRLDAYSGFYTRAPTLFNPFSDVLPAVPRAPQPSMVASELLDVRPKEAEPEAQLEPQTQPEPRSAFPFFRPSVAPTTKAVPMDQPRGKNGERLLYTYPNLPMVYDGEKEYTLLVGSSDKHASAWLLQFDGAANPNPGPASAGAVLWSPKDANGYRSPSYEMGKFLGKGTNNLAEIQGLLLGLKIAAIRGARELLIEGDSELIIRQQTRQYKVSNKNLKSWWAEIQAAMMDEVSFDWIAIRHVRREFNERADSITKEVLSKREGFTRC